MTHHEQTHPNTCLHDRISSKLTPSHAGWKQGLEPKEYQDHPVWVSWLDYPTRLIGLLLQST